jgi:hypothetical protein
VLSCLPAKDMHTTMGPVTFCLSRHSCPKKKFNLLSCQGNQKHAGIQS